MKKVYVVYAIILLILVACGGEEPVPTMQLVVPTPFAGENVTSVATQLAATALVQTTAVALADTPTAAPSATPTVDLAPTATGLPPTLVPLAVTVVAGRPFVSQDLLFIGDGELRKWSRRDGTIQTLLFGLASGRQELVYGTVQDFAVNGAGTQAVVARALPNEPDAMELLSVQISSGEGRQVVAEVSGLIDMALSPDGRSALYAASDADRLYQAGPVYRLEISGGFPTEVGTCTNQPAAGDADLAQGMCAGVTWTRDSQNMLWSDAHGIWLRHINASQPTLILPVPAAEANGYLPLYLLRSWSPDGRYLLLTLRQFERTQTAVLDLATNRLIPMPGTTVGADTGYADVDWMQDGRLFLVRQRDDQGNVASTLQLWRLTDGQLNLEETTALALPPHNWLQDGVHFITGRFAFTLLADDPQVSGLYLMASSNEPPQKVNQLPYTTGEATWLYDNVGTIFSLPGQDNAYLFLAVEPDEAIYEIRPFLGEHASHFYWLPR